MKSKKYWITILIINTFLIQGFTIKMHAQKLIFKKAEYVARVTGTPVEGKEDFPSPNNTSRDYNVGGTDLGIIWKMNNGQYGIFLGDTYGKEFVPKPGGPSPGSPNWRCNVLAYSDDQNLDDGLILSGMVTDTDGNAREIIYGAKDISGSGDWTSIPTAAICANKTEYVHYMNVRNWEGANWATNHSGLYRSADNGLNWDKCNGIQFGADSNFGQVGYFKKGSYVYMIGTESGRSSSPRLARIKEKDMEDQSQYEYWNNRENKWIKGDESEATNLFDDTVGELSIIYHKKSKQWIMTYFCNNRYNISIRYAKNITGDWSEPQEIASGKEYTQLYGSYIHPISENSNQLYFLMSLWVPYNAFLMKSEILQIN